MNRKKALEDARLRFRKVEPKLDSWDIEDNKLRFNANIFELTIREHCQLSELGYLIARFEITKKELRKLVA